MYHDSTADSRELEILVGKARQIMALKIVGEYEFTKSEEIKVEIICIEN